MIVFRIFEHPILIQFSTNIFFLNFAFSDSIEFKNHTPETDHEAHSILVSREYRLTRWMSVVSPAAFGVTTNGVLL